MSDDGRVDELLAFCRTCVGCVSRVLLIECGRRKSEPSVVSGLRYVGAAHSIRMPEMAREITSCWICSVPSKMSWV